VHESFEFERDGKMMSLSEAMAQPQGSFHTVTYESGTAAVESQLKVPYKPHFMDEKEFVLSGDKLIKQVLQTSPVCVQVWVATLHFVLPSSPIYVQCG
jgi:hypothetical protein